MKRDMDLCREILFAVHESDEDPRRWVSLDDLVAKHSQQVISYHVVLLAEAELIEATNLSTMGPNGYRHLPSRLTWKGQEFLDSVRKDTLWEKAKQMTLEKTGGLSFQALSAAINAVVIGAISGS
ncbi:DUF2513 domain-containing protein [Maricaulis sp.]|uniref:DUF2513 domain-containing protein n=1 Tax=Maricaulis sp. TaxID=1486257 RepID=UPI003296F006